MANPFTAKTAPSMMPGDWESQQRQIDYERKLAEKLAGDTEMPQGGMVGGVYVPPAWTQMLAKALNPMWAKQHRESADKKSTALGAEMQAERAGTMDRYSKALQGTPESMTGQMYPAGGNPDEEGGMGYQPAVAGSRDAALAELAKSRDPAFQQMAMAAAMATAVSEISTWATRSHRVPVRNGPGTTSWPSTSTPRTPAPSTWPAPFAISLRAAWSPPTRSSPGN